MKYFSFRIIILCILMPPAIYLLTILSVETYLSDRYAVEIEEIYTGDTRLLFSGAIRLKDAVNDNIDHYLESKPLLQWGVKIDVTVTSGKNTILYPLPFEEDADLMRELSMKQVAADNFRLMNEGLLVDSVVRVERNKFFSNTIFGFYYFTALMVLYLYYRAGSRRMSNEYMGKSREIEHLLDREKKFAASLASLGQDRKKLSADYIRLKQELAEDKKSTSINETEMVEEIVALEEKIADNLSLVEHQQDENTILKELIQGYEKEFQKAGKKKDRDGDLIRKRFNALYKSLSINDRAVKGYTDLTEEIKIKAEEVIHQLNEDPAVVAVKRKVFTKRGKQAVLEVMFAYNGRLYYRHTNENRIEILTIGNKKTQSKDLAFLENLK
jgi:hypothetical protein